MEINDEILVSERPIWDIILGFTGYPAIFVALDLGLYELLARGPLSISEIAKNLNLESRPTEALVYTNVSLGFMKIEGGAICLTKVSEHYMLRNSPTSFCSLFETVANSDFLGSIKHLKQAVLTNKAQTYAGEQDVFKSHKQQFEQAKHFTKAMHSISVSTARYWVETIDLSSFTTFLDIGCGSGAHSLAAVNKWPELKAILFDIEPVCSASRELHANEKNSGRLEYFVGDLWESDFPDADVHFYSQIFHDWSMDKCEYLANKSYKSMKSGGRIVLQEMLYHDDKTGPFFAASSSVNMLLWTEGMQYSGQELEALLKKTGFINIEIKSNKGFWHLVVGQKP